MTIQPNPSAPQWPAEFQGARITGAFLDLLGNPIVGEVRLTPTAVALIAGGSKKIIVGATITVPLDVNGACDFIVPATDDPDINPTGWTYSVVENFPGGRSYSIDAPTNSTRDLSAIAPVPSSNGESIVRGPAGPESLVVRDTDPNLQVPGLWVQTGLGPSGNDFTIWIEDGN